MAEELLYEDQIANNGDPKDPLGLRKKLQQKADPLGLRKKREMTASPQGMPSIPKPKMDMWQFDLGQPEKTEIQKVDYSKPVQEPKVKESVQVIPGVETQIRQVKEKASREFITGIPKAQQDLFNELIGNDALYERIVRNERGTAAQQEQMDQYLGAPRSDMPSVQSAALQVDSRIERTIPAQDLPVSQQDIIIEKQKAATDELRARNVLEKMADLSPEKKGLIQSSIYKLDIARAIEQDPDALSRFPKIVKNSKALEKGDLIYDIRSGQLIKPENIFQSFKTAWKHKEQNYEDFERFRRIENNEAIAMDLDDRLKNERDEPFAIPEGKLGTLGSAMGGMPLKVYAATAVGGLGGPGGAAAAGSAVGAREAFKLGWANEFKRAYYELRQQGLSGFEAVSKARTQADNAANIDAIVGGVSGLVAARIPYRQMTPVSFSGGFRKSLVNAMKGYGQVLSPALKEGIIAGGIAAGGERYKNELAKEIGIERGADDNIMEVAEMNLLIPLAIGAVVGGAKIGKSGYRHLMQGLHNIPEGAFNNSLSEAVGQGIVTEEQATAVKNQVEEYGKVDATIPKNIDPEARVEILGLIERRNELEKQLESTDKAFHPEIKEKIKELEEKITESSANRIKPDKQNEDIKRLINEGIEGELQGFGGLMKDIAQNDPMGFMKFVADQALGRTETGQMSDLGNAEYAARESFGDAIVDKAIAMFPPPKAEVAKESSITVIRPEERTQPTETITIKPKEDAIPIESALNLPEKKYGESSSNKDIFPERSQTQPRINRKTATDLIGETQTRRLQASLDWIQVLERGDREAIKNAEEQLIRESLLEEVQDQDVLASDDTRGAAIRASSDYGTTSGAKTAQIGTRSPQERGQLGQQIGKSGTSDASRALQATQPISEAGNTSKNVSLSEAEARTVVQKVRELSKLRDKGEKARSGRSLYNMLEQTLRENPSKTKEIIDLITENLPDYGTIRERISKEASLGETPINRSEMGEGIPKPEEPTREEGATPIEGAYPGEEKITPEDQQRMAGITHAQMNRLSRELGMPIYEKAPETVELWDKQADERIAKNPNAFPELFAKLRDGQLPDNVETRMMLKYQGNLEAKYNANPTPELLNQIKRTKDIFNIAGREWGKAGRARQGSIPVEETLADFHLRDLEASRVGRLTEKQEAQSTKEFKDFIAAKRNWDAYYEKKIEEAAIQKAEKMIGKIKSSTSKPKKSHESYAQERKNIIQEIKDKLKKSRGETSAVIVPYAKELIAIAPDVAKLVKNLVEEGIDTLPAVIKAVHDQLKDVIDGIRPEDVRALIAGEYNEKLRTRSEITAKIKDLKDEASLIGRLQALEEGIEPKSERAKKARNREIEELKQKIKEHDLTKLAASKSRMKTEIAKLEKDIAEGRYEPEEKTEIKLDEEGLKLKDRLIELRKEREIRLAEEEYAARGNFQKGIDIVSAPFREVRTLKSSFDLSAPFRQGVIPTASEILTNPARAGKRFLNMLRSAKSEKYFDRWMYDLKNSPQWRVMEESGLAISEPGQITKKEEVFQSRLAQKIPGVKGSERAYSFWLNAQRADLFKKGATIMEDKGMTFENSKEAYQSWANTVNALTGRGELVGPFKNAAELLSIGFFSPRLIASRLSFFNPRFYKKIPASLRLMIVKDMLKFIGLGISVLQLGKLGGADVEDDPRSPDFGKMKFGNTRYDIWGGFQQYIRLFSQLLTQSKKTSGGDIQSLINAKDGSNKSGAVIGTFFRSKAAPLMGSVINVATGEDVVGQPVTLSSEAKRFLLPILWEDVYKAAKDEGVKGALATAIPGIVGVGVQTYDSPSSKKQSSTAKKVMRNKTKKTSKKKTD